MNIEIVHSNMIHFSSSPPSLTVQFVVLTCVVCQTSSCCPTFTRPIPSTRQPSVPFRFCLCLEFGSSLLGANCLRESFYFHFFRWPQYFEQIVDFFNENAMLQILATTQTKLSVSCLQLIVSKVCNPGKIHNFIMLLYHLITNYLHRTYYNIRFSKRNLFCF